MLPYFMLTKVSFAFLVVTDFYTVRVKMSNENVTQLICGERTMNKLELRLDRLGDKNEQIIMSNSMLWTKAPRVAHH